MKLVVADCSAIYTGRGDTSLPRGVRAIMIKSDGSVSIHNDVGNKPLNYMKDATFSESKDAQGLVVWNYDTRRESLAITIHGIIMSSEHDLIKNDPGLERDGTEDHLQVWLSDNPQTLGNGYSLVSREFPTGNGPVDLLVLDENKNPVAVEVKRVAMIGAVDQCRRYVDSLKESYSQQQKPENSLFEDNTVDFSKTRAIIAALDIRPRTIEYAKKHNIQLIQLPSNRHYSNPDLNQSPKDNENTVEPESLIIADTDDSLKIEKDSKKPVKRVATLGFNKTEEVVTFCDLSDYQYILNQTEPILGSISIIDILGVLSDKNYSFKDAINSDTWVAKLMKVNVSFTRESDGYTLIAKIADLRQICMDSYI